MPSPAQSARAAGKVSLAVFLSRILGLVRDQVFAKLFGAGLYNDAWLVAFRVPNLLRDLFAEGALSSAFIPTFTEYLQQRGRREAWLLANLVLSWILILLGAFTLALLLFSRFWVYLLAAGFAEVPGKLEVTALLLQILSPFLMLVAAASVAMGVLNTLDHFFLPALAPALFNLSVIAAGLFLAPRFEAWGILPIHAMAVGALAGGFLQYGIQLPLMRRHGFRFSFRLQPHHEGLGRIARLILPAVVGVSAVQVNVLVNTQIASFLGENGPVSWLSYAFRIIYLPIGLFGVSVGVVNLRDVSRHAAEERWPELRRTVASSIKLVALLAIPSTVGVALLSLPIVDVLFRHGDFTRADSLHTAWAVVLYALGLFSYSCMKVWVPTFYALGDTRTPVRVSLLAVATNLGVNLVLVLWVLPGAWRYLGLALGTSISVTLSNLLLARSFRRRLGALRQEQVLSTVGRTLAAALLMGMVLLGLHWGLEQAWGDLGRLAQAVALGLEIASGAAVYFLLCRLFRVREIDYIFQRMRRAN